MLVPLLFASVILFGSLAVLFSYLFERNRKKLRETEKELGRQLFELNILRDVSDKVGYSLKTRDIARTIVLTSEKLFPLKTASYAVVEDGAIIFEAFTKGNISEEYLSRAKGIVMDAMFILDDSLTHFKVGSDKVSKISESDKLSNIKEPFDTVPRSYFNIPLVLNNRFVGMISITSPREKVYQDKDMSLLYKIVNQAQLALGRLENVIETEKGKIQSLIYSLSSGALLFMNDPSASSQQADLKLVTMNNAARYFLQLDGPLDTDIVLSQFKFEGNIVHEIRQVMAQKKIKTFRGVELFNKRFNLYITPVFDNATQNAIGVAMTMQDVTLEYESEKLRENFTNMVVHELRAPLTSIKGSAELLGSNKLGVEDKAKMLETIVSSSERMLNDVNQLLDAAKIQNGQFETDIKVSDLTNIIEERIKMFKILAEKRHIAVVFERNGDVPQFAFDPLRIGQILNNLLSNAVKYNHENGKVTVREYLKGNHVVVEVEDDGPGIPKNLQEKLFSQFYQTSISHRGSGTGLGLYISRAIIEAHGGLIYVQSQEGYGTKVTFELPLRSATSSECVQSNPNQKFLN